ncbi:MAG TPA: hypothetical protein PLF81_16365, partial [Candidatus Anammoximicrobium sp.]|nr:hypothetical protein [Candidatus Anammoximicrobium sp.]
RNAKPTGLTIDPTGGSQSIWVVDDGTNQVFEYANAQLVTSGSLTATHVFQLAAGNSGPQDIADPRVLAADSWRSAEHCPRVWRMEAR